MKKTTVIILDDNELERLRIKESFEKSEEFEVIGDSNDGLTGYEMINNLNPELVITDLVLQSYDGFALLEKIGELQIKPKILIVSSLKNDEFIQKSIDLGANYYMIKPIIPELLLKRAKEIMQDKEQNMNLLQQKSPRMRALEEKISNIFITVGIPAHIKGYQFLREAIKMAIDEPSIINSITGQLYPSIASRFSTSASKVERAIRHAIEVAWNRGKIENINNVFGLKVYNSNEKPTNGEFIALVADKMLVEGA